MVFILSSGLFQVMAMSCNYYMEIRFQGKVKDTDQLDTENAVPQGMAGNGNTIYLLKTRKSKDTKVTADRDYIVKILNANTNSPKVVLPENAFGAGHGNGMTYYSGSLYIASGENYDTIYRVEETNNTTTAWDPLTEWTNKKGTAHYHKEAMTVNGLNSDEDIRNIAHYTGNFFIVCLKRKYEGTTNTLTYGVFELNNTTFTLRKRFTVVKENTYKAVQDIDYRDGYLWIVLHESEERKNHIILAEIPSSYSEIENGKTYDVKKTISIDKNEAGRADTLNELESIYVNGSNIYTWSNSVPGWYETFCRYSRFPNAVTISSVTTRSKTSLEVKWNTVSNANQYRIDRRADNSDDYVTVTTVDSSKTSYTDSGLTAGTKYYYRVYGVNSGGTSPRKNGVAGVTRTNTPKVNSVTTVSETSLKINWSGVTGAQKYIVCRKKEGTGDGWEHYSRIAETTGTEYLDTGLEPNTKYYYGIVAVTETGVESGNPNENGNPGEENRGSGTTLGKYAIDLNRILDGQEYWELAECGTVDIYINGNLDAEDVSDYWKEWPEGTRYEIKDIKPNARYSYDGVKGGSLSGTVGKGNVDLRLIYTTVPTYEATPGEQLIPDGWYMIGSGNDNDWVLDINGWNQENGGNLELYHRNNTTNQRFYLQYLNNGFYSIKVLHSGKYIRKKDDSSSSNVFQWDGYDSKNAQWKLVQADEGYFYLEARSGGYLDNLNGSTTAANNIRVFDYNGSGAQKWRFFSTNTTEKEVQTLEDGWYTIESGTADNLALGIQGSSTENGANVLVWTDNKTENQQFYVQYRGDGYYTISPNHSGKFVSSAGSEDLHDNVCQTDVMDKNSLWCLEPVEDGSYQVRCKNGNYLDNSDNCSAPGNNVSMNILSNGTGGPEQNWRFVSYNGELPEPMTTGSYNTHNYEYYNLLMTWPEAKKLCETKGGHLVTISSQEENDYVYGLMQTGWIGANDIDEEGSFAWVTGEPFGYSNWRADEPNNASDNEDAVQMWEEGVWNDYSGDNILPFVCEYGIDQTSMADCEITLSETSFIYDGSEKKPSVTVKYNGEALNEDIDYSLSYKDNVEAGEATVTISGKGDYTGEAIKKFSIINGTNPSPNTGEKGKVSAASLQGSAGSTIAVPITIDENPGIIGINLSLGYDESRLKLVKVEPGEILDGSAISQNYMKNPYRLSLSNDTSTTNIERTGVLVTAYFEILTGAGEGDTDIELIFEEAFDKNLDEVTFDTVNGGIHVQAFNPGDVNGDGQVKLNDAIMLRRYVAGWDIQINTDVADVNDDGQVKLNDAILLRRFVAGWDVVLQ